MRQRRNRLGGVFALALCATLAAACGPSSPSPLAVSLNGRWEWIGATGGVAGQRIAPDSVGYHIALEFTGGTRVRAFRDGAVRSSGTYSIDKRQPQSGGPAQYSVVYGVPLLVFSFDPVIQEQRIAELQNDTLRLSDPCCDKYSYTFVRAK